MIGVERSFRAANGKEYIEDLSYHRIMLRYHVAFYLQRAAGAMVVAEALDFPGAVTQGFDLPDARLMIASAMEDLAESILEEGKPLPVPNVESTAADADLIEIVPLSVSVGTSRVCSATNWWIT